MEILMVINPVSGNQDKAFLVRKLRHFLEPKDTLELYKTNGQNDKEQIANLLQKNNFDRILVAGGDGSIKMLAECLQNPETPATPIAILPAGSANGLASDLNLPQTPETFLKVALGNKTRTIDAININNELGLHISDFGLNAELIKEFTNSSIRGKLGYALNSIPTLIQNEGPYPFTIKTKEKKFTRQAIMIALANSKKFGTGAIVNPDGKIDDGIFELLIFKKLDVLEILKTLNEEAEMSKDFVEIIPLKEVKISTPKPVSFQIDGEYCEDLTNVSAKIVPKILEVYVP
ncbi:diacylglycerol/lipid kinase family protein [Haloflavibacter putidus]|uniref:Diacylglycerol kinase n=1 Tax=Haloflavibacter putidus TaxID=2576776 RepID=A0A507ZQ50_9FLAO|nr:diacylglycerol kinase family protein [Haloflavibacter putidus]TQD39449.1 diacylglycerol kinase [Haloflavibacter putidus]